MRARRQRRMTFSAPRRRRSVRSMRSPARSSQRSTRSRTCCAGCLKRRSPRGVGDSRPRITTSRTWSDRTAKSCTTSAARTVNHPRAQGRCHQPERAPFLPADRLVRRGARDPAGRQAMLVSAVVLVDLGAVDLPGFADRPGSRLRPGRRLRGRRSHHVFCSASRDRAVGAEKVGQHWPGSPEGLATLTRLLRLNVD
jgi:hypothetical protein